MKGWSLYDEQKVKDKEWKTEKWNDTFINCATPKNATSMDVFLVKM
jgi:hypothetical protein